MSIPRQDLRKFADEVAIGVYSLWRYLRGEIWREVRVKTYSIGYIIQFPGNFEVRVYKKDAPIGDSSARFLMRGKVFITIDIYHENSKLFLKVILERAEYYAVYIQYRYLIDDTIARINFARIEDIKEVRIVCG